MNLLKFVLIVSAMCLSAGLIGEKIVYGIYEDQFNVCNFNDECVTIDSDDFMDESSIDEIWEYYTFDIDTFDIGDID